MVKRKLFTIYYLLFANSVSALYRAALPESVRGRLFIVKLLREKAERAGNDKLWHPSCSA
jgi:hypothetical protein